MEKVIEMKSLTSFQKEFDVNDFNDASAFHFLASQHPEKIYRNQCNSCEYYLDKKCISGSNICTYKRRNSLSNFYKV